MSPGRAGLRLAVGVALMTMAASPRAQTPDSVPDSAAAFPVAVDSTAAGVRPDSTQAAATPTARTVPLAAPQAEPLGRAVTPVPALTGDLAAQALLDALPQAFGYALGAPGRWGGVSLWGLAPSASSLTLDGRDASDLYTGAARIDLLPGEALGPLRLGGGTLGAPTALSATVRPFRLGRPITELRYLSGHEGVQHAGATHAQTRRAPGIAAALVGADARMTFTAHAATQNADAQSVGGQLRHSHALGRLVFAGRSRALELGGLYVDHGEGARRGASGFGSGAAVAGGTAARKTLKTETWATFRAPLFSASPTALTASWTGQRLRYSPDGLDTLAASANRYALSAAQGARLGLNRLHVRAAVDYSDDPSGGADAFGDRPGDFGFHLVVSDSLTLGGAGAQHGATLVVAPGVHAAGGREWASVDASFAVGALRVGVARGARGPSVLTRRGLSGPGLPILADPNNGLETTTRADATVSATLGAVGVDLSAWAAQTGDAMRLVARGDTAFAAVRVDDLSAVGGALTLALRASAERGLYARTTLALAETLGADSDLARRDADALPSARLDARIGARARDIGDGVLDLDLGVRAQVWTAFRSRIVEPTTGRLALPDPASAFGAELPARGTVGLDATATFSGRAVVFIRYDHALGGRAYDGATLTQGEPLADTAFRFGVFWALLD